MATRTWVSGVGDDVNPGSRTAPCKTFAGAISKTQAPGEISVLDPGGFGAVTINKAILLNGDGTLAGILVAGTNGITVTAGANDVVVLRNLSIDGGGSGLDGVKFTSGAALHVENCTIYGFTGHGINVSLGAAGKVFVKNTDIKNCGGSGIFLKTTSGTVAATIEGAHVVQCGNGLHAASGARATICNSTIASNGIGILADQTAADSPLVHVTGCTIANNTSNGIQAGGGIATIYISRNAVVGNLGTGLANSGGSIVSVGENMVIGNNPDGAPSSTVPAK